MKWLVVSRCRYLLDRRGSLDLDRGDVPLEPRYRGEVFRTKAIANLCRRYPTTSHKRTTLCLYGLFQHEVVRPVKRSIMRLA